MTMVTKKNMRRASRIILPRSLPIYCLFSNSDPRDTITRTQFRKRNIKSKNIKIRNIRKRSSPRNQKTVSVNPRRKLNFKNITKRIRWLRFKIINHICRNMTKKYYTKNNSTINTVSLILIQFSRYETMRVQYKNRLFFCVTIPRVQRLN